MARARNNGSSRLEDAIATLIQNQASFVAQLRETDRERAEYARQRTEFEHETKERFKRIETLLIEHNEFLQTLADAIREKIGFKIPDPPKAAE